MTTLPGQDASLPAQQPYITGQQPMYQQVSLSAGQGLSRQNDEVPFNARMHT